jgi:transcription elongation regulator 1
LVENETNNIAQSTTTAAGTTTNNNNSNIDLLNQSNESIASSPRSDSNSPNRTDQSMSPTSCQSPSRITDEFLQKEKIEASKEAALEAEHKAAQVRAQLPLEQRIEQFKEMLIEKEISAYSTWEKELQKIVFDPRYLLLTSKERKQVFDKYVRDRANQESKERAAALKRKKEAYRELLKEAGITQKSSFADFSANGKYSRDERFKQIDKMKERESLFNDYLSDLRKQEKEQKYADKEKLKKAYVSLLKEQRQLHRHSSWHETKKLIENDSRYKAIDSSSRREDYFRDYCKYLDEKSSSESKSSKSNEKQQNKETNKYSASDEPQNNKSKKSSSSDSIDKDQEMQESSTTQTNRNGDDEANSLSSTTAGANDSSTEENGEAKATTPSDEEKHRKEKEKQERIEASLRERNKQVKEQLSKYQNEREKERDLLRRDETIECFKALLIDLIKSNY